MVAVLAFIVIITALCVVAYIVGSELCLPAARKAIATGRLEPWLFACRLVTMGQWSVITVAAALMLLIQHTLHAFSDTFPGRVAGMAIATVLTGAAIWEGVDRAQRRYARVLSESLDMVLPASGRQREVYDHNRERIESGTQQVRDRALREVITSQAAGAGD
jgi:hypothetical protein